MRIIKRTARAALLGVFVCGLSSCALFAPPEPCTSAWYDYEAREAFAPVRRDLGRTLNRLADAQEAMARPDPGLGAAVQFAFAAESGLRVIETLDRESIPRLQSAAQLCADPGFVRRAVFDFLDEEGVDELLAGANALPGLAAGLNAILEDAATQ